jgi:hypothetical protein
LKWGGASARGVFILAENPYSSGWLQWWPRGSKGWQITDIDPYWLLLIEDSWEVLCSGVFLASCYSSQYRPRVLRIASGGEC